MLGGGGGEEDAVGSAGVADGGGLVEFGETPVAPAVEMELVVVVALQRESVTDRQVRDALLNTYRVEKERK